MYKRRVKRKRSKVLTLLVLPALIFIGFIGWLMYIMGEPSQSKPKRQQISTSDKQGDMKLEDSVTFIPASTLDEKLNQDEEIIQ